MKTQHSISNIVKLLATYDPPSLHALKIKYPEYVDELAEGELMDWDDSGTPVKQLYVDTSIKALENTQSLAASKTKRVKQRRKTIKTIQLSCQIIQIVSGAAVMVMIEQNITEDYIKYIAPTLVLGASVMNIYAQHMAEPFIDNKESLPEISSSLLLRYSEAQFLLGQLKISQQLPNDERWKELVPQADNLCKEMYVLINKMELWNW